MEQEIKKRIFLIQLALNLRAMKTEKGYAIRKGSKLKWNDHFQRFT